MRWSVHAFRHFLNRDVEVRLNSRTVLPSTKPIRAPAPIRSRGELWIQATRLSKRSGGGKPGPVLRFVWSRSSVSCSGDSSQRHVGALGVCPVVVA